ncbi:MAG: SCP2 sterol-binding domain-containing protein [Pseudonocardiaceae bacterium]
MAEFAGLLAPGVGDDIAAMQPRAFGQLIKNASAEQLDAVLSDPVLRRTLLDRIFSRMAGQFRPEHAPGPDSAIHWQLTDGPHGDDRYEIWITGTHSGATPQCSTSAEPSHEPRLTLTMSGEQFLELVSGNSSPAMMLLTGKVKLNGDIGFAAQLTRIFDMPAG